MLSESTLFTLPKQGSLDDFHNRAVFLLLIYQKRDFCLKRFP